MNYLNVNFINHGKKTEGYWRSMHLSIVDALLYHFLVLQSLWMGANIVLGLMSEQLIILARFVLHVCARLAFFISVCARIFVFFVIRLPALFLAFCLRASSEYIAEFFSGKWDLLSRRIRIIGCGISERVSESSRRAGDSIAGCVRRIIRTFGRIATLSTYLFSPKSYALPRQWRVQLAAFSSFALLLVFPFIVLGSYDAITAVQYETAAHIENGIQDLLAASEKLTSNDSVSAHKRFEKSLYEFTNAENTLTSIGAHTLALAQLLPLIGTKVGDAESLIDAGKNFSEIGMSVAQTLGILSAKEAFSTEKIGASLSLLQKTVDAISIRIQQGQQQIASIHPQSVPAEYRRQFQGISETLTSVERIFGNIRPLVQSLPWLLGIDHDRRYLVVLQNSSEIRATGGFMGSFALLDVKKGAIKKIDMPGGGTYDVQGQLREWVVSPWPLHLINARWEFQDANWFPDFPASARKIKWFYERAGGPTVDGVIAINASLASSLLSITGPIEVHGFGKTVTSENFFEVTEKMVELEYNRKENKPKKFLGDLIEVLQQRLQDPNGELDGNKVLSLFLDAFIRKEIQFYSTDPNVEDALDSLGLSGRVSTNSGDYLLVVDSNIGGRKTDRVMVGEAWYRVEEMPDGTLEAILSISRTHNGVKGDYFIGGKNILYTRIYVPEGSVLLSASGFAPPPRTEFENPPVGARQDEDLERIQGPFTVDEKTGMIQHREFGKTVFSNWVQTAVGQTTHTQIRYRLPFMRAKHAPYTLTLQRQSSSPLKKIEVELVSKTQSRSQTSFVKSFDPFSHDEYVSY